VYEPDNNRFDHHQRGFGEVFGHGYNTKLSSAGASQECSSSQQRQPAAAACRCIGSAGKPTGACYC
jgi:hypothetical protein